MNLQQITDALRESRGFAHKRDIGDVVAALGAALPGGAADMTQSVPLGDDCAAIPDGAGGHLLFAIEGLVEDFIERMPWFAGWCSVMVNISDVAAMGGRAIAVVDAIWSRGMQPGAEVLAGMAAASAAYGVPIVGGHSNNRSTRGQLAVAILGRAKKLLTSFDAKPGERLLMAVDLRGAYQEPFPYWNAATEAPPERLRGDLELLPRLAESGLCRAAKDISMAGTIGTALMLLECSRCGATIDLDAIPRPPGVDAMRWLVSFPSFGHVMSVAPADVDAVRALFRDRGIACAEIGTVEAGSRLKLRSASSAASGPSAGSGAAWAVEETLLWDWATDPFITAPAVESLA